MKKILIFSLVLFLPFALNCQDNYKNDLIIKSQKFISLLLDAKYDKAYTYFDTTITKQFSRENLESTWNSIQSQLGKFEKIVKVDTPYYQGNKLVVLTSKFENMYIDIRFTYNQNKNIIGFFFVPNNEFAVYTQPDYVNLDNFNIQKITFGKKEWELHGELDIPKKPANNPTKLFPVVIMLSGSGPNDMDESIAKNKPFRDLAWGLASKGIASFRYNKRTKEHPRKIIEIIDKFTLWDEVIEDALEAINKIANNPDINPRRIYVLGHSLGASSIPRVDEKDKGIKGFILMAGNSGPLQNLILKQFKYIFSIDGKISDEEQTKLDTLKAEIDRVNSKNLTKDTPMDLLPLSTPASYWLDIRDYYPAKLAKNIRVKMLILQGGRDYQVPPSEFNIWKKELKNKPNVKFKLYPKLNHLFMEGKGKSTPDEYLIENHIPEYVINDIVKWIK